MYFTVSYSEPHRLRYLADLNQMNQFACIYIRFAPHERLRSNAKSYSVGSSSAATSQQRYGMMALTHTLCCSLLVHLLMFFKCENFIVLSTEHARVYLRTLYDTYSLTDLLCGCGSFSIMQVYIGLWIQQLLSGCWPDARGAGAKMPYGDICNWTFRFHSNSTNLLSINQSIKTQLIARHRTQVES